VKRKIALVLLCGLLPLVAAGCIQNIEALYTFNLIDVHRSDQVIKQYGKGEVDAENLTFKDELLKVTLLPQETGMGICVENRSNKTIKIVWDECSYMDIDRTAHRILHLGTRLIHSDQIQPVSAIAKGAKLEDLIVPAEYAEWVTSKDIFGNVSSEWQISPLLPKKPAYSGSANENQFKERIARINGNNISVLLSISVEGVTSDYLFTLSVRAWTEKLY